MTAKERILTIRLLEKLRKHPNYANVPAVEATGGKKGYCKP